MRVLILLAIVASASAAIGRMQLNCEEGWILFKSRHQASCLRIVDKPKLFMDAYKACNEIKADMLSFAHQKNKIEFVNDLLISRLGDEKPSSWFFDKSFVHKNFMHGHELPKKNEWAVMEAAKEMSDIKLSVNSEDVPRNFICEKPALPTPQAAKFSMEPEDAFMSDELLPMTQTENKAPIETPKKPFIISFNCRAFALPKPTIKWVTVRENETATSLDVTELEPKIISDPREPLRHETAEKPIFYDLRRDCQAQPCKGLKEQSQLILVGAQYFDTKQRIACLASNKFGEVISREAQIVITTLEQFPKEEQIYSVMEGKNQTVSCELAVEPDAASAEWLRIVEGGRPEDRLIPLEQINKMSRGGIQMSKATFDLVIDFATPKDSGRYMCRVKMHNGRGGFVIRERVVRLEVEQCREGCDLSTKPVLVADGYPALLSLNQYSNDYIRFGDDFVLECPCLGKRSLQDMLEVEWKMPQKVGEAIKMLPRGSAVLVRDAKSEYSGEYSCRCMRQTEQSEWESIDVNVLPLIAPKPMEAVVAKVNGTATLSCQMPKIGVEGLTATITPMRGSDSLIDILRADEDTRFVMTVVDEVYTIKINNVTEEDTDTYGCRVSVNYFSKWTEVNNYYVPLIVEK